MLIVEDSDAFLHLIRRAFDKCQGKTRWELTVATDGEQALHLLFEEEEEKSPLPNIILLDWNLPKISGNEVLRRVKEHQKLRGIPVLVFSSSEADSDIHQAYENHANGYIAKPSSPDLFVDIVKAIELFWVAIARLPKVTRS